MYFRVDKLKRFDTWTTYLYLLCFVHHRYQRLNDNLINCLLYRVKLYADQAKEFGNIKLSSINLTTNQSITKAADVLRLMTDEQILPATPFGIVQQKAFEILSKDEINQLAEYISQAPQLDEVQFRWEYLDKIAAQFKLNLRHLLINVEFADVADNSDLSKAINFLRQTFKREQSLTNINLKKFPLGFIKENYGQVYIRTDDIDKLYQSLTRNNVRIHPAGNLQIKPWGQKEFSLLDPDNNLLTFGQSIR